jgi:hypothetical protein
MIMPSPHQFRNINIGDLLIQEISNPTKEQENLRRRGIIVNVENNISTIEWTFDGAEIPSEMKKTTILNVSLRRMILDGYILHYPVQK